MGTFSPAISPRVQASSQNPNENCVYGVGGIIQNRPCHEVNPGTAPVAGNAGADQNAVACTPDATGKIPAGCNPNTKSTDVYSNIGCDSIMSASVLACLTRVVQFFFITLPSLLTTISARMFDFLAGLTLSSEMYKFDFIGNIWVIVRDFSNIAFILVLLYAAFQMILGLGHSETKKLIAGVVVMALMVNFSLFFTRVVVDSGNILGLIFYNRIIVDGAPEDPIADPGATKVQEKSISRAIANRFDITKVLNAGSFKTETTASGTGTLGAAGAGCAAGAFLLGVGCVGGAVVGGLFGYLFLGSETLTNESYLSIMGIMVAYGLILYMLAYSFLVAAFSFLARMLTLIMLMVVSPFAFVSYAVPGLKKIGKVGFDSWLSSLLSASFMGAVFMFILYVVTTIMKADIFTQISKKDLLTTNPVGWLVVVFVPSIMICMLLLAGTKYAKKASGEITGVVINGAKVLAGLAVGGAALGTAGILRGTVGAVMKKSSTGDIAANRIGQNQARIAANQAILNNAATPWSARVKARTEIRKANADIRLGNVQNAIGIGDAQRAIGRQLNADQQGVAQAEHARRDLDQMASNITHGKKKTWEELNGEERRQGRRDVERDRERRALGFGNVTWANLNPNVQATIDAAVNPRLAAGQTWVDQHILPEAMRKQGSVSNFVQSTVTGSYDVRGLAKVIAKEQSTGFAKLTMGLTGAIAMGMRGGFKQLGVNYGEPQHAFLKDLGHTITEALKSMKVNVDLSHVGEQKKEGDKGGGGHH